MIGEQLSQTDAPDGTTTTPPKPVRRKATRTKRRELVKAGVVIGGVAAATYVTPTLKGLGVPVALAVSGITLSKACTIALSITSINCSLVSGTSRSGTFKVSGQFTITNASSDCGACEILSVNMYLQNPALIPTGSKGCGKDLTDGLLSSYAGQTDACNTSDSNQVSVYGSGRPGTQMISAGCTSAQGPYNYCITYSGAEISPVRFTLEMTVYPTNAQQTGFQFKACDTASC